MDKDKTRCNNIAQRLAYYVDDKEKIPTLYVKLKS